MCGEDSWELRRWDCTRKGCFDTNGDIRGAVVVGGEGVAAAAEEAAAAAAAAANGGKKDLAKAADVAGSKPGGKKWRGRENLELGSFFKRGLGLRRGRYLYSGCSFM